MTDSTNDPRSFEDYEDEAGQAMDDAMFGPLVLSFAAAEVALLQDCVAETLASMLSRTPMDLHTDPRYMARYEALVELGRRVGMEL